MHIPHLEQVIKYSVYIYQPYNPLFDLFCLYLRVINS